tara:strand:+ start:307 stop:924 length:618 start_codon:yes stop_codon:yes gene_type:complete
MSGGWIRVERGIVEHWVFSEADALKLWVYLLMSANYEDKSRMFNGHLTQVKRGQLIYGRHAVSQRLGISEAKLRRYMKQFIKDEMISQRITNKYSVITITCYEKYQDASQQTAGKSPTASRQSAIPKQVTLNNKQYIPPSVGEVESYCESRGNGIKAEAFVDYYEARGWMIGKNKMKSWQSAVRTWENRRKEQEPKNTKTWELER